MATNHDFDLICIGSGPAGQRAAVQAAKLGKRVAVIEKRLGLGGVSVETGTIPSKTFREAVLYFSRRPGHLGESPRRNGDRPTADQLLARVEEVLRREAAVVESQLGRNEVEIFTGEASFKDPHTLVVEQDREFSELTASNILIAVGTTPTAPPGVDEDGESVITSDGIVQLRQVPKSMTVVGGGVIGLEYASMFAELGVDVTVVDRRKRPLEFVDGEIVDELIHQMRARDVTFRLGESVEHLERQEAPKPGVVTFLQSGKRIVSDLVLFSIGRTGATGRLNLAAAGLEADLRGRLAACFCFGKVDEEMSDNFPIGIYAIPEMSMVGKTEEQLTEERVPYETGVARYKEIARGQILGDESGFLKLLFHRQTREVLGVHIIGTGATELLHIGQAVLRLGGGLDYFLRTVFNYPTLAECYKVAALDASNKLTR